MADWNGRGLLLPTDGLKALSEVHQAYLANSVRRFTALGESLPGALRTSHRNAIQALTYALAKDKRACLNAFAMPTVGTPLECLPLREELPHLSTSIVARARDCTPHLLLELAARRLLPEGRRIVWPGGAPVLASPYLGLVIHPPPSAHGLVFSSGCLEALGAAPTGQALLLSAGFAPPGQANGGFRLERGYHPITQQIRLAVVDDNPIAAIEAHPEKSGNALDLGGRPIGEWIASLGKAFSLIQKHAPELSREMSFMLQQVVPVGYSAQRHLSASYREAVGTIYLTLHPNVLVMAEAVIHEFQHNKLCLGDRSLKLLRNAFHPLYPSPVRPDPRPLWGVLMAVHAFLPVAAFYRRMRASGEPLAAPPDVEQRLEELDLKNREGLDVLKAHADWTEAGRALMEELAALDERHLAERSARGLSSKPMEAHEA